MSSDSGELEPRPAQPDLRLPEIRQVRAEPSTFKPTRRNFKSDLPASDDAVDVIVETAAPIPIRDLGPVLYVGDVPLTEVTQETANIYRFVARNRNDLQNGAPISLGWTGSPADDRVHTDQPFILLDASSATPLQFELYQDQSGEYRWRLQAGNGEIIAHSAEGYDSKAGAERNIEDVKRIARTAPTNDRTQR